LVAPRLGPMPLRLQEQTLFQDDTGLEITKEQYLNEAPGTDIDSGPAY